jgi:two-component system chemotaxis response regulator CheB
MTDTPNDRIETRIREDIKQQEENARSDESSVYTCPDCGGVLWEFDEGFACHTGHRYTPNALLTGQATALRAALMVAVRVLQERAALLRQTARKAADLSASGHLLEAQAQEHERCAGLIKAELLDNGPRPDHNPL